MNNILCVDDTQANLLVLKSLFQEYDNKYKIITVSSGDEALGVLLSTRIDLILLDVMMPDLDGFETAELIKANKKTRDIPIIFLTAKKDDKTIHSAFEYGVDYLSKPYDEFELFARVNTQIKLVESKRKLDEQIKFNQSVLDSQYSILFIQNTKELISANKTFLNFFKVKDIKEFEKKHISILDIFVIHDDYFSKNSFKNDEEWIEIIYSNHKEEEHNVLLMDIDIFEPKAFKIDVNKIEDTDKYVVTLIDITALTTKSKQFENKATYDDLTKVYNRGKFNETLLEHYNLFKRYKGNISFAIFDIDFFKQVNDTYGHIVGDETLITFARMIEKSVRSTDVFARWGGEEFTLLMPETNIEDGFIVVEKLRDMIENISFKTIGQKTCSVGVTQFKEGDTIDSILIRADEALYDAKETGRNKVCIK